MTQSWATRLLSAQVLCMSELSAEHSMLFNRHYSRPIGLVLNAMQHGPCQEACQLKGHAGYVCLLISAKEIKGSVWIVMATQ